MGRYYSKKEWEEREKLARKQSALLKKSWKEKEKLFKKGVTYLEKYGTLIPKSLIKKEKAWAKRDMALRRRLRKEFKKKFPR